MTASALTDIYYIACRLSGAATARSVVRECLDALTILGVDGHSLEQAYALAVVDFEDALQIACAVANKLDAIVTRDPGGFTSSSVPVWKPAELVARLPARP